MGEKLWRERGRGSGRIGENWEEKQSRKNGRRLGRKRGRGLGRIGENWEEE